MNITFFLPNEANILNNDKPMYCLDGPAEFMITPYNAHAENNEHVVELTSKSVNTDTTATRTQ